MHGGFESNIATFAYAETWGASPVPDSITQIVQQLQSDFSITTGWSALGVFLYLIMGGVMSLYLRFLYSKFSVSASHRDSVTRVFPMLTLVTIGVIAVVKSSLALSLGLVGALSIVRFRAAIKEPEELVYLFLCIGVGLAMGAQQPWFALALVAAATIFIVGMSWTGGRTGTDELLLTITGDAETEFGNDGSRVFEAIESSAIRYRVQRFDLEEGRGQLRIVVHPASGKDPGRLIQSLRGAIPGCDFSYVNLSTTI